MKIGLVIERMEPWRGGAETSTNEIARLLSQRGHDVHIITGTHLVDTPGLTVHRIPTTTLLRPLRTATFVRRAADFVQRGGYNVVLATSPLPNADVYEPRGGLMGETLERNIATRTSKPRRMLKQALMATSMRQRSLHDLERAVFREGGPIIVAVSHYVARQCERFYGVHHPRVRVIFNGVNTRLPDPPQRAAYRSELRALYHIPDDALLLLFVAHNFRLKGLAPLIDTLANLVVAGFTRFRLLVAGRDNPVGYQRQIDALKLGKHVTFIGPTQRSTAFFAAADVLVHPTYYDPCSRVVLEALSLGLPAITTSFNGAAEVMTDGREGFIIESPDALGMWARRIEELANPELREKMSERSIELRDKLSMRRHVEELDILFAEIQDRKKSMASSA